jgi:DNA-directed RNA polymerase subunit RPC12/RpoP
MAWTCPGCNEKRKERDRYGPIQENSPDGPSSTYYACAECFGRVTGKIPDQPGRNRNFPEGTYLCGICDDEFGKDAPELRVRLHPDDLNGDDVKPGLYVACPDCVNKYRAKIAARLTATDPSFAHYILRASGMDAREAADLAAIPGAVQARVKELGIDPLPHCVGDWLR